MVFVFDEKFGLEERYYAIKINRILNENKNENEIMITVID